MASLHCTGTMAVATFAAVQQQPTGPHAAQCAAAFMLSATVLGYIGGAALPPRVQTYCHPVLICGLAGNAAAAALGQARRQRHVDVLHDYISEVECSSSSGDALFLDPVQAFGGLYLTNVPSRVAGLVKLTAPGETPDHVLWAGWRRQLMSAAWAANLSHAAHRAAAAAGCSSSWASSSSALGSACSSSGG